MAQMIIRQLGASDGGGVREKDSNCMVKIVLNRAQVVIALRQVLYFVRWRLRLKI